MRLKTKIKWKFYNSLLSIFLIHKFQIWLPLSVKEIQEIPFFNGCLEIYLSKLKKEFDENVIYFLEMEQKNIISIWYIDSNKQKIQYQRICLNPQFNYNKSKLACWLCK